MGRAKLDRIDDWFFGSRVRRGLLMVLSTDSARRWTQAQLAREVGAADKGTIEAPLHRLAEIGVARREDDGLWTAGDNVAMIATISALLEQLERASRRT